MENRQSTTDFVKAFLLWLVFGGGLIIVWYSGFTNPAREYQLLTRGKETPLTIYKCSKPDFDENSGLPTYFCEYHYVVNNDKYTGDTERLYPGAEETITYLPANPSVHQLTETVATSFSDWLIRKVVLNAIITLWFLGTSVYSLFILIRAVIDWRRQRKNNPEAFET